MENNFDPDDAVCCPCPKCCESNPDMLAWQDDDETVVCQSCGTSYEPGAGPKESK